MNKRQLIKELQTQFDINKPKNKNYDFEVVIKDTPYQVLVLKSNTNTQITVNSKTVWEFARGSKNGIRFKKSSSNLIGVKEFMKEENKIIFLTNRPYRILRHLNECDIVEVNEDELVHGIRIFESIKDFVKLTE